MKQWTQKCFIGFIASTALLATAVAGVSDINQLLDRGEAEKAFTLAESYYDQQVGSPEFDFYYALAAIETGQADKAIFPLERLVIQYPKNARARLELARAFFLIGDYASSRQQFEKVKAAKPPENVIANIDRFLFAIEQEEIKQKTTYKSYASLRLGTDTNVNSFTDADSVITNIGEIILTTERGEDAYMEYELGGSFTSPLSKDNAWYGNASGKERIHSYLKEFDLATLSGTLGYQMSFDKNLLRFPVTLQHAFLDREDYRSTVSFGSELTRQITPKDQLALAGHLGRFRYPDNSLQDVEFFLSYGSFSHSFSPAPVIAGISLIYIDEAAKNSEARYNGKSAYNLQLNLQWFVKPKHVLYASAYKGIADYKDINPVFTKERDDESGGGALGWIWQLQQKWQIKAEYSYRRNDSNISVYDYARTQLYAQVRYDFD